MFSPPFSSQPLGLIAKVVRMFAFFGHLLINEAAVDFAVPLSQSFQEFLLFGYKRLHVSL